MTKKKSLQVNDLSCLHPHHVGVCSLENAIETPSHLHPGYDPLIPSRTLITNLTSPPRGINPFTTTPVPGLFIGNAVSTM